MAATDVADYEGTGHTRGLAAGLEQVLHDLTDTDLIATAPGRFAAVPAGRAGDETTVEHGMAALEGVAILDLRLPDGLTRMAATPGRTVVVGLRLAAVRIGLTRRLLDQAVEHLGGRAGGGEPLIRKQLNQGTVADVLAELEMLRRYLETTALSPTLESIVDLHERLTGLDWEVTKLFGASGYLTDHPVRALYVAGLAANTWVHKGELS
jgi:Acyl-CoA dehydrogenase, C-terminal domain